MYHVKIGVKENGKYTISVPSEFYYYKNKKLLVTTDEEDSRITYLLLTDEDAEGVSPRIREMENTTTSNRKKEFVDNTNNIFGEKTTNLYTPSYPLEKTDSDIIFRVFNNLDNGNLAHIQFLDEFPPFKEEEEKGKKKRKGKSKNNRFQGLISEMSDQFARQQQQIMDAQRREERESIRQWVQSGSSNNPTSNYGTVTFETGNFYFMDTNTSNRVGWSR